MLPRSTVGWTSWEKILAILATLGIITLIILLTPHSRLEQEYCWRKELSHTEVSEKGQALAELTSHEILETLKSVQDPEICLNIVDLGLVYGVEVDTRKIMILLTVTSPNCPVVSTIVRQVKDAVFTLPHVREVRIRITLDPPWTVDRVSKEARDRLLGIPGQVKKTSPRGPA
jgi:metal-sulfur cluster biosynthetic enzyme